MCEAKNVKICEQQSLPLDEFTKNNLNKKVGKRIAEIRKIKEKTQQEFASEIGVSQRYLSDVELGKKGMSVETLRKVSIALQMFADWLLYLSPDDK